MRLLRGEYDNMTVYGENPVAVAASFAEAGAKNLHVVDLDGALSGNTDNMETIKNIISETKMRTEVGGGIRDEKRIYKYLSLGAERVILGTVAAENPAFAEEMVKKYGSAIAVGADVKNGEIATHGWTKTTGTDINTFMKMMENMGVATVICTDVSRDGALMGTNMELYRALTEKYGVGIIASGGITAVDEVFALAKMGVYGAILGKAIYNGNIDLREAVKAETV